MRVTNIAHARQEIGRFCAEVTHPPAGTKDSEETRPLLAGKSILECVTLT